MSPTTVLMVVGLNGPAGDAPIGTLEPNSRLFWVRTVLSITNSLATPIWASVGRRMTPSSAPARTQGLCLVGVTTVVPG